MPPKSQVRVRGVGLNCGIQHIQAAAIDRSPVTEMEDDYNPIQSGARFWGKETTKVLDEPGMSER
jgi:hypothetical protein